MAGTQCSPLRSEQYKLAIQEKENAGVLVIKKSKNANFSPPQINNCYVTVNISMPNGNVVDNEYGGVDYLFDPRGELVDARPYSGPNIMQCNAIVKKETSYFASLLVLKRKENANLPRIEKLPVRYTHIVKRCTIHLAEIFQDDPQKPSVSRTWFFDHNGNIIEFTELKRSPKIYAEDKNFNLR